MAKADGKNSTKYAAWVLREAKLGNTAPLAGFLRAHKGRERLTPQGARRLVLTPELLEFLAGLAERAEGKLVKDELRRLGKELIRQQVKGLMDEEGLNRKAAITEVMNSRGIRSPETIYAALRDSKKRK
jgi:hypothetical protein